jgi:hypothetical protein
MAMKKCSPNKAGTLSPKKRKIIENFNDILEIAKEYDGYTFEEIERFKDDPAINEIFSDYQKVLFKAIRADLHNHPIVAISNPSLIFTWRGTSSPLIELLRVKSILLDWIITHRRLGDKKLLRKVKRGLEVGVNRPLNERKVELKNAVEELRLRKKEVETPPDMDDNTSTLGDILQQIRLKYDPNNPPSQSIEPKFWTEVHRNLVKRGIVKTSRQVFLREIQRISPSLFPRPQKPQDHSK